MRPRQTASRWEVHSSSTDKARPRFPRRLLRVLRLLSVTCHCFWIGVKNSWKLNSNFSYALQMPQFNHALIYRAYNVRPLSKWLNSRLTPTAFRPNTWGELIYRYWKCIIDFTARRALERCNIKCNFVKFCNSALQPNRKISLENFGEESPSGNIWTWDAGIRPPLGLVVRVPGYISRGPRFDSRRCNISWEVGLERGPLSLLTKKGGGGLIEWKSCVSSLKYRD
jgi:hypothetical protein